MKSLSKSSSYDGLIRSIGVLLEQGRRHAFAVVNPILVRTYWSIGEQIIKYEHSGGKDASYGGKLFERIATDLKARYGTGFSRSNIIYMRLFYKKYQTSQTLSDQLSWSHYVELLDVEEDMARQFYEKQCVHENWSVRLFVFPSQRKGRIFSTSTKINKAAYRKIFKNSVIFLVNFI